MSSNDIYRELDSSGEILIRDKISFINSNKLLISIILNILAISSFLIFILFKIKYNIEIYFLLLFIIFGAFSYIFLSLFSNFLEMLLYNYPARIKLGARKLGKTGNLPISLYNKQGPLQNRVNKYIKRKKLSFSDQRAFDILKDEWNGSIDELFMVVNKISNNK
jgi:hypothetical protein